MLSKPAWFQHESSLTVAVFSTWTSTIRQVSGQTEDSKQEILESLQIFSTKGSAHLNFN